MTSPPWFERLRYPLHYSRYVRVHAREHDLDPALLAAVIYQESKFHARREVGVGRDRADAAARRRRRRASRSAPAARASGRATSTTPRSTSATARGTCSNLFQQVRQRAARARRLQRRPGQRRPLARRGTADPVPGDARLRRARRAPEAHLPRARGARARTRHDATDPRARREREHLHAARPRPTSGSSPTATCSGWAAATIPAGTSRSASGFARRRVRRGARRDPRRRCGSAAAPRAPGRSGRRATPADLVDRLLALGLVDDDPTRSRSGWRSPRRPHRRHRRTSRFAAPRRRRSALAAAQIAAMAFGTPVPTAPPPPTRPAEHVVYLAYVDGKPVARATASFSEHGVTLFGGATLPEARGRGAYRALVPRAGTTPSRAERRARHAGGRSRGRSSRGSVSARSARSAS